MKYRKMDNDELVDLLFNEADRLPKSAVDEFLRRSGEIIPELSSIVMDRFMWTTEPPDWWATVHATYILGAVGTEEVLTPLLASLRWSDAYDNEWVAEDLPSIFGSMGKIPKQRLEAIVADRSAGWSARAVAMDGLAAIAIKIPELEEETVRMIAAILGDSTEDDGARRAAGTILVDLRRLDCKDIVMKFAKEDEKKFKGDEDFPVLSSKQVEKELAVAKRSVSFYTRGWMTFYDADEIRRRQRRWAEETDRRKIKPHTRIHTKHVGHIDLEASCPCGSGKKYRRCCWQKIH